MSKDACRVPQAEVDARLVFGRTWFKDEARRPPTFRASLLGGKEIVPASGGDVQIGNGVSPQQSVALGRPVDSVTQAHHGHEPVLVSPILRLLNPGPGEVVLDGTIGLAGHAAVLLPRILPGGRYIGIDADERMLAAAREQLPADLLGAVQLFHANYADCPEVLRQAGLERVDHVLLDLGVNSAQLDDPQRGFSFSQEGPLDMRFDTSQRQQAVDIVNSMGERDMANLFFEFGQESNSRKIAKKICHMRHASRITSTRVLARLVESAFPPGAAARSKTHLATRVFQALRVAINREFENLERFLETAIGLVRPGGHVAVISFHSLEDGLVKRSFRAGRAAGTLKELTKRPIVADDEERARNPRSRSAKLRVAERV